MDRLLEELQKYGATTTLLDRILALIVDADKRTEIARKLGRHMIIIEVIFDFHYFCIDFYENDFD